MSHTETQTTFVKILQTDSLTDIALIKSVLDAEEVEYFVHGENMKFINIFYDPMSLMVAENDVEKAVELLKPLKLNYSGIIFGE